jgi:hypothetical protein
MQRNMRHPQTCSSLFCSLLIVSAVLAHSCTTQTSASSTVLFDLRLSVPMSLCFFPLSLPSHSLTHTLSLSCSFFSCSFSHSRRHNESRTTIPVGVLFLPVHPTVDHYSPNGTVSDTTTKKCKKKKSGPLTMVCPAI